MPCRLLSCTCTTTAPRWFELTTPTTMVDTAFSGLNPYDDYTIHAENDGVTSKSRTVSLIRQELQRRFNLKIYKQKNLFQ